MAAGYHKNLAVWGDHEVARMAPCVGIADLLQLAILQHLEYADAVVLQTVRCVEPLS